MHIRSWRRKAPTASSAKLASHTRLLAAIAKNANCLLFALVLLFPFTQKTALSSLISYFGSLVFCVWEPCVCSTSELTSVVLFVGERVAQQLNDTCLCACRKERSDGIAIATKSIASRVPRYAVVVGSLKQSAEGERNMGATR